MVAWLSTQLAKQKRNDFKPRDDDLSFARVNTEPCVACCESLEKVRDCAKQSLGGKNLEVFLTEIGVAFHRFAELTSHVCTNCILTSGQSSSRSFTKIPR